MASLISDTANGRWRILFYTPDGKHKTLRIGKVTPKQAQVFLVNLEALITASSQGTALDKSTAVWLAGLGPVMHERLVAVGLVKPRQAATLGAFLDHYFASRTDIKSSTATIFGHTRRNLLEYFGADKPLDEITAGDADEWRLHLIGKEQLADNTVRRRCGLAKQFLKSAVRLRLISENPFAALKAAVGGNDEREYFLIPEDSAKVLQACPDGEWRLIFALCRWGGLRCPSEVLGLRWADVNWELGRVLIHSVKTERHKNKGTRFIPLFPELEPHLLAAFTEAGEGAEYAITRYRDPTGCRLRTQFRRILIRAGLTPWPKLFQNLRATRATELAEKFPAHVCSAWMGHSQAIARKHYLMTLDEHFDRARAALNPATYSSELTSTDGKDEEADEQKRPILQAHSDAYSSVPNGGMGAAGLGPATSCL